MTILFSNHSYKYEVEATIKLFFPARSFDFIYEERNCTGDIIMTRVKTGKIYTYVYAYVRTGIKKKRLACHFHNSKASEQPDLCEYNMCKLVFQCLTAITGIIPDWGMLTGIRPIKKVTSLIEKGFNKKDILSQLKDQFLVSNKKLELAYSIAQIQMPLLACCNMKTISLYVSIPFCPSRCSYCSFVSHSIETAEKLIPDYVRFLCTELQELGIIVQKYNLKIDTIYIGGGTPTSIKAHQLYEIMRCISDNFDISAVREYNVEAGRADTITLEKLKVIKDSGATRISVNPQTLNDDVLKAIGRVHTSQQTIDAYISARDIGFDNINMDLIAGLPTESFESFKNTLDKVIDLAPDSITVHTLTIKRSASLYSKGEIYFNNPVSDMVDYSERTITENGYNPYYLYRQKNTIDNLENVGYAKSGKESLYNIFIMDETQTILGAGCAASTKLIFSNGSIKRVHNYKFPYEYINRFNKLMNKKYNESKEWINMIERF